MNDLASYAIQATVLGAIAFLICLRQSKIDLFVASIITLWTASVIAIFAKYREAQVLFYSNDQAWHQDIINVRIPYEGIQLSITSAFNFRYLVTVPAYIVSQVGGNPMLFLKFLQLVFLLLIYFKARRFLSECDVQVRAWQLVFFSGPIMIFMSVLALRDLALGYFALLFVIDRRLAIRLLGLLAALSLRPHLAAALIVGWAISEIYRYFPPRLFYFRLLCSTVFVYTVGAFSYWYGATVQQGASLSSPTSIFTQSGITRLAANFLGLQFLTLDDSVVEASRITLVLARFVFVDTLLIPLMFLITTLRPDYKFNTQNILVFHAFIFFSGLVSQTDFNSSRQNIAFFVSMGVLVIANLQTRNREDAYPLTLLSSNR